MDLSNWMQLESMKKEAGEDKQLMLLKKMRDQVSML
jgi:hypothetical protein